MILLSSLLKGRQLLVAFFLSCASAAIDAKTCFTSPSFDARLGTVKSQWLEYAENDRKMVHENGLLDSTGFSFGFQCDRLEILLDVSASHGVRRYQGETNRGRRVESTSSLEERQTGLSMAYPVFNNWRAKTAVRQERTDRSIADADDARGYKEQYTLYQWSAGIGRQMALSERLQLSGHVMLGMMPKGTVSLKLPGTREMDLKTGNGHLLEFQTTIGYKIQTLLGTVNASLTWTHSQTMVKAGRQAFAFAGSRPVLAVHQPAFKNKADRFHLHLGMAF